MQDPARFEKMIAAREAGDFEGAEAMLRARLEAEALDVEAQAHLAHILALQERDQEAAEQLARAEASGADSPAVRRNVARLKLKRGDAAGALDAARAAHEADPGDPENQLALAAALGASDDLDEAMALTEAVLKTMPGNAEAHVNRATLRMRARDGDGAIADLERAVALKPHLGAAWRLLGRLRMQAKDPAGAASAFQQWVSRAREDAQAWTALGEARRVAGDLAAAQAAYEQGLARAPEDPTLLNALGMLAMARKDLAGAAEKFRAATEHGGGATAYRNLGAALYRLGREDEAQTALNRALKIEPKNAFAHFLSGMTALALARPRAALAPLERALKLDPTMAEAHGALGGALLDLGEIDPAEAHIERALSLKPELPEAHNDRGRAHMQRGARDAAVASFTRAIELKSAYTAAYRNLSLAQSFTPDDPVLAAMQALGERDDLSDQQRMHLGFALGKAHDDLNQPAEAFRHFAEGNRLRRAVIDYQPQADSAFFETLQSWFARKPASVARSENDEESTPTPTPIFVLGLPRSGTTLTEQTLARHPKVHGGGELDWLDRFMATVGVTRPNGSVTPEPLRPNDEMIARLREEYRSALRRLAPDARFVTDKAPLNFRWIGMIRAALPEAVIVHMERDPRDVGWSIFRSNFTGAGARFAYDLEEIGGYWRAYSALMAHWRKIFPGVIYDLNYEALAQNPEIEIRRLLAHCRLIWRDECVAFHESDRAIATASSLQVREAMNTRSIGAWKRYENELSPMLAIMNARAS